MCMYMHAYNVCMFVCVFTYVCMNVFMYAYFYVFMHLYVCISFVTFAFYLCLYTYMHMHASQSCSVSPTPYFAGGFDLLKLRSDGPSNSITSETETNSSDKACFHLLFLSTMSCIPVTLSRQAQLLLCARCASYYLASENVPISCKFHPGSLRIGNDWTAKWSDSTS